MIVALGLVIAFVLLLIFTNRKTRLCRWRETRREGDSQWRCIYCGAETTGSRGKTPEQVDAVAGGRVWSGQQAIENGLVDEIGGIDKAVAMILSRAGIKNGLEDVEVRHMPQPSNFADAFLGQLFDAKLQTSSGGLLETLAAQCGPFGEVVEVLREALTSDGKARIYALMPAGLRVR